MHCVASMTLTVDLSERASLLDIMSAWTCASSNGQTVQQYQPASDSSITWAQPRARLASTCAVKGASCHLATATCNCAPAAETAAAPAGRSRQGYPCLQMVVSSGWQTVRAAPSAAAALPPEQAGWVAGCFPLTCDLAVYLPLASISFSSLAYQHQLLHDLAIKLQSVGHDPVPPCKQLEPSAHYPGC